MDYLKNLVILLCCCRFLFASELEESTFGSRITTRSNNDENKYGFQYDGGNVKVQTSRNEPFHAIYTVKKSEKEEERIHYAVDNKGPRTNIHSNLINFEPRFDPASIQFGARRWPLDELNDVKPKSFAEALAPKYNKLEKEMIVHPGVIYFKPSQLAVSSESTDVNPKKQMNRNTEAFLSYSVPFIGQFSSDFDPTKTPKKPLPQEKFSADSIRNEKTGKEKLNQIETFSDTTPVEPVLNLPPSSMDNIFESQRIASPVRIVSYPQTTTESNLPKQLPVYNTQLRQNLIDSSIILSPKIQNIISQTLNPVVERINASFQRDKDSLSVERTKDRVLNQKSETSKNFVLNPGLIKDNNSSLQKNVYQDLNQKPKTSMYFIPNLELNRDSTASRHETSQDVHQDPKIPMTFISNLGVNGGANTLSHETLDQDLNQKPKTSMYFVPNLGLNRDSNFLPHQTSHNLHQKPKISVPFVPKIMLNIDNNTLYRETADNDLNQKPEASVKFVPNLELNRNSNSILHETLPDLPQDPKTSTPYVPNLELYKHNITLSRETADKNLSQNLKTAMYFDSNIGFNRGNNSLPNKSSPVKHEIPKISMPVVQILGFNKDNNTLTQEIANKDLKQKSKTTMYFVPNIGLNRDLTSIQFNNLQTLQNSVPLSTSESLNASVFSTVFDISMENGSYYHYLYVRGNDLFNNLNYTDRYTQYDPIINILEDNHKSSDANQTVKNNNRTVTVEEIENSEIPRNASTFQESGAFSDVVDGMNIFQEDFPISFINKTSDEIKNKYIDQTVEDIINLVDIENPQPELDTIDVEKVMIVIDDEDPQSEPDVKDVENEIITDIENPLSQTDKEEIEEIMRIVDAEDSLPHQMDVEKVLIVINGESYQSKINASDVEKIMRIINVENSNPETIDVQTTSILSNETAYTSSSFLEDLFENNLGMEEFTPQNLSLIYFEPTLPKIGRSDGNEAELFLTTTETPANMLFATEDSDNDADYRLKQLKMNIIESMKDKESVTVSSLVDEPTTYSSIVKTRPDSNSEILTNFNSYDDMSIIIPSPTILPDTILVQLNDSFEKTKHSRKDKGYLADNEPIDVLFKDALTTVNPILNKFAEDLSLETFENDKAKLKASYENNVIYKIEDDSDFLNVGIDNRRSNEKAESPKYEGNLTKSQNMFSETQIPVLELFIKHTILNDFLLKINNTPIIIRVVTPDIEAAESIPVITRINTVEQKVLKNNINAERRDKVSREEGITTTSQVSNIGENSKLADPFSQLEIINFKETSGYDNQNAQTQKEDMISTNLPLQIVINKMKDNELSEIEDKNLNLSELESDYDDINQSILLNPETEESNFIKMENTKTTSTLPNALTSLKDFKIISENLDRHIIEKYRPQESYFQNSNMLQETKNPFLKLWKGNSGVKIVPFGVKEAYKVIPVFQEIDNDVTTPKESQIFETLRTENDGFERSSSHSSEFETGVVPPSSFEQAILNQDMDSNNRDGLRGTVQYIDYVPYQDLEYDNRVL
ncbi:hypothetical protein NPIL_58921 [Nephila pilipes]|uniref:Uncharacterized protein n=1 Tax=Nephila pilipes TaxID=299642 RepID=A0A8X6PYJ2_NEPPI|nr:hypothetical protein NPIL_58921 [Nephila pilipes]